MNAELTAPFCFKDSKKKFVYGAVLIPNERDADGDVVTSEKIEEVAHEFAANYQNIDVQHSLNNVGKMLETHIQRTDWAINQGGESFLIPKGAWMMGVRVEDRDTWDKVEKNELSGFSIMGMPKTVFKSIEGDPEAIARAEKKTTLHDLESLGKDWIVTYVSLVDKPAVPKAKFIVIKKADGFIPGSHEHIRWLLGLRLTEKGLEEKRIDEFGFVDIQSVDDKKVTYRYAGDEQLFQLAYEYDGAKKDISLKGTEKPVDMEMQVVPDRVMKGFLEVFQKAFEYFKQQPVTETKDLIDEIKEPEVLDMTKEETQALIEEVISPIREELAALKVVEKVLEPQVEEPQPTNEEIMAEIEAIKEYIGGRQVLNFRKPASKSLSSSEEDEPSAREYDSDRDALGRKIKAK